MSGVRVWAFVNDDWSIYSASEDAGNPEILKIEVFNGKVKETKSVPASSVHRVDASHLADLDDLCYMNDLHEAPLLNILKRRLAKDKIYTFAGDILISLNPYKRIEGLYDNPMSFYDIQNRRISLSPATEVKDDGSRTHIYQLANTALRDLVQHVQSNDQAFKSNQSVIVSGESGAGKTEAAKYVLNFLISANEVLSQPESNNCEKNNDDDDVSKKDNVRDDFIRNILLLSGVILEAFGNSKTVRNDNSSRFGKYIRLEYTATSNVIVSAFTETFLLEKSRIVHLGQGERNYHIFYQMVRGLEAYDSSLRSDLKLFDVDKFALLTAGSCTVINSEEADAAEFASLVKALVTMEFTEASIKELIKILAAILHLGNTSTSTKEEGVCADIASPTMTIADISALLGVSEMEFTHGVCYHKIASGVKRQSMSTKVLSAAEVKSNILGLVKWVYSKIFDFLVLKINTVSKAKSVKPSKKFIGILDIFGFEILQTNSLEQLCINYTNERLQQQFNDHVFTLEQHEYQKEGINWENITFRDNQSVIDLIGKKPHGVLCVLEEHGIILVGNRKPDDVKLVKALDSYHDKKHPHFERNRFNDGFTIKHYAGEVFYTIAGFLEKNNDSLQEDTMLLLKDSSNPALLEIVCGGTLADFADDGTGGRPKSVHDGKKMASAITVSFQFREQLDRLMTTLRETKPHYIKCIKPNANKQALAFTSKLVIEQLRYSGALEVVRIRREGYPYRMSFDEFLCKFDIISRGQGFTNAGTLLNMSEFEVKKLVIKVATGVVDPSHFQVGRRLIFLKQEAISLMQDAMNSVAYRSTLKLQALFRKRISMKRYMKSKWLVSVLQKNGKMILKRNTYNSMKASTLLIQRNYRIILKFRRAMKSMRSYLDNYHSIIALELQRTFRGHQSRKLFEDKKKKVLDANRKIGSTFRMSRQRRQYAKTLDCVRKIQSVARMRLARNINSNARQSAVLIQKVARGLCARRIADRRRSAVPKIQSMIRMYIIRNKFSSVIKDVKAQKRAKDRAVLEAANRRRRLAAVSIQKSFRSKLGRDKVTERRDAISTMQALFRRAIRRTSLHNKHAGVVAIQSRWRAHTAYAERKYKIESAKKIQATFRSSAATKRYAQQRVAAIKIESLNRMLHEKRRYAEKLKATKKLQGEIRSFLVKKHHKDMMLDEQRAAERLQHSAIQIQRAARGKLARNYLCKCIYSVYTLQNFSRMIMLRRKFNDMVFSAVVVQSALRMQRERRLLKERREALAVMQRGLRSALANKRAQAAARSQMRSRMRRIIRIQSVLRMRLARARFLLEKKRIIVVQALTRKRLAAKSKTSLLKACIIMKKYVKNFVRKKKLRDDMMKLHLACKDGDIDTIRSMLAENPTYRLVRNASTASCSLIHSAGSSEHQLKLLQELKPTMSEMFEEDANGNCLFHHCVSYPSVATLRYLCDLVEEFQGFSTMDWDEEADDEADEEVDFDIPELRKTMSYYSPSKVAIETKVENTIISGWVKKRRDLNSYKRRFCVLTDKEMLYFKSPNDSTRPLGRVPLEGCKIERCDGPEPIFEIKSPTLVDKKSIFGRIKKKSMFFLCESEKDLQHWLIPLKHVASHVKDFRQEPPVRFVNKAWRAQCLSVKNNSQQTVLHILVFLNSVSVTDAVLDVMIWIIENGCNLDATDADGLAAIDIALMDGAFDMAAVIYRCGADATRVIAAGITVLDEVKELLRSHPDSIHLKAIIAAAGRDASEELKVNSAGHKLLLPSPPLFDNYAFISLQFHKHEKFFAKEYYYPFLTVSLLNSRGQPIEDSQTLINPVVIREYGANWMKTVCIQTPIQNIELVSFILVQFRTLIRPGWVPPSNNTAPAASRNALLNRLIKDPNRPSAGGTADDSSNNLLPFQEIAYAVFDIDPGTINSGIISLPFYKGVYTASSGKSSHGIGRVPDGSAATVEVIVEKATRNVFDINFLHHHLNT